jgi:tRNA G18 (ribose-2'-O)-methylase SpoU
VSEPVDVTDADDERLADYRHLTDAALRRAHEAAEGVCIAEGELVVRRAVSAGATLRSLLVSDHRLTRMVDLVAGLECPVYVTSVATMKEITGFTLHRGVVAAVARPPELAWSALAAGARRLLVLEAVNDHENLGVLFRTASALGADAVLLDPHCTDPLYRRSIRVSMGSVLALPFARISPWPDGIGALQRAGFTVAALTPGGDTDLGPALADVDRLAVLMGAEGPGLTPEALAAADVRVRIPMAEGVDSLNVGTAAGIALFVSRVPTPAAGTSGSAAPAARPAPGTAGPPPRRRPRP